MRALTRLTMLALLAWIALPMGEAAAQFGRGSTTSRVPRDTGTAVRPPPPALPGLQNRRAPEPIPADPTQVLSPNAALFDAINRGDLPAARDAVARGADLESRNVLGLTPTDAGFQVRRRGPPHRARRQVARLASAGSSRVGPQRGAARGQGRWRRPSGAGMARDTAGGAATPSMASPIGRAIQASRASIVRRVKARIRPAYPGCRRAASYQQPVHGG